MIVLAIVLCFLPDHLILKAPDRESVRAEVAVHGGTTSTIEAQAPGVATIHGTRPIAAVGARIAERTIAAAAAAGDGQFKG